MSDAKKDEIKGRAKEAAGAVTGDEELKDEGRADQASAEVKGKIDEAADRVKDAVDDVTSRFRGSD